MKEKLQLELGVYSSHTTCGFSKGLVKQFKDGRFMYFHPRWGNNWNESDFFKSPEKYTAFFFREMADVALWLDAFSEELTWELVTDESTFDLVIISKITSDEWEKMIERKRK